MNDHKLLNDVYQNARMGMQAIPHLMNMTEDPEFRSVLDNQLTEYTKISDKASEMLKKRCVTPEDVSPVSKVSSYVMTEMKTLTDKSPSKMAEMMIQGSSMGITTMIKAIHDHPKADKNVTNLAERLVEIEERNIRELREYL